MCPCAKSPAPSPSSAAIAGTTAVANAAISQDEAEARATGKPGKTPHTKFALNIEMWGMGMGFYDRIDIDDFFPRKIEQTGPWAAIAQQIGVNHASS